MPLRRAEFLAALLCLPLASGCSSEARGESAPAPVEQAALSSEAVEAKPSPAPATASPTPAQSPCPHDMVWVRGGRLHSLERASEVVVGDYCLDPQEVSVDAFAECVTRGGCKRDCGAGEECPTVPTRSGWGNPDADWTASKFCNGRQTGRGDHPVNCVSIEEAAAYCAAQGGRLPSADEWEWAARRDEAARTPWGSPVATDEICWGKPKKRPGTCVGGSFASDKTPEGLFDMGGNVSEWVTPPERAAETRARFACGASWYAIDDGYARAALAGFEMPATRAETVGFRCAAALR